MVLHFDSVYLFNDFIIFVDWDSICLLNWTFRILVMLLIWDICWLLWLIIRSHETQKLLLLLNRQLLKFHFQIIILFSHFVSFVAIPNIWRILGHHNPSFFLFFINPLSWTFSRFNDEISIIRILITILQIVPSGRLWCLMLFTCG